MPAGTRQISVRIDAIRDDGSYNDAYIDNVSLVLGAGGGGPGLPQDGRGQGDQRQGPRPAARQQRLRRSHGQRGDPARLHGRHAGGRGRAHVGAQGGRQAAGGRFYEGVFKVTQPGSVTNLALTEPLASCRGGGRSAAATKKKQRHLWGDGKGAFRTAGKYSSATVRGTKWLVKDSCAGTLTRVVRGTVTVRDKVRGKTVVVSAGKSYLAKP